MSTCRLVEECSIVQPTLHQGDRRLKLQIPSQHHLLSPRYQDPLSVTEFLQGRFDIALVQIGASGVIAHSGRHQGKARFVAEMSRFAAQLMHPISVPAVCHDLAQSLESALDAWLETIRAGALTATTLST
jgi:hypothetical protein